MCIFVQFPGQPKLMQWCCHSCLCCSGNSERLGRMRMKEGGLLRWAAVSGAKHVSMGRREFEQMSRWGVMTVWDVRMEHMVFASWNDLEAERIGKKIGGFSKGTSTDLVEKAEENCRTKFLCLMEKLRIKDKEAHGRDGVNKIFENT